MEGEPDSRLVRALEEGARRSLEAQEPRVPGTLAGVAELARRHRWKLVGLLLLLLTEIVLFFVGSTSRGP